MNKDDLVRKIQEELPNHTLKDIRQIVDTLFDCMSDALSQGEEVSVSDFGTFSIDPHAMKSHVRSGVSSNVEK